MPIASILIPVFNRPEMVIKAVNSAQTQTIHDIEIIICDNASQDNTYEVLLNLEKSDSRIKVFRNNENIGPVENWKSCVEKANAPLSKILFSDDLISPQYLEKTIPSLNDPDCAFAYSHAVVGEKDWEGSLIYRSFLENTKITKETYLRGTNYIESIFPVSPCAAIFRTADLEKSIFTKLPGVDYEFSENGAGVDWLIYSLIALNYNYVSYINEPLVFFRSHEGSITINNNKRVKEGYKLAREWLRGQIQGL